MEWRPPCPWKRFLPASTAQLRQTGWTEATWRKLCTFQIHGQPGTSAGTPQQIMSMVRWRGAYCYYHYVPRLNPPCGCWPEGWSKVLTWLNVCAPCVTAEPEAPTKNKCSLCVMPSSVRYISLLNESSHWLACWKYRSFIDMCTFGDGKHCFLDVTDTWDSRHLSCKERVQTDSFWNTKDVCMEV